MTTNQKDHYAQCPIRNSTNWPALGPRHCLCYLIAKVDKELRIQIAADIEAGCPKSNSISGRWVEVGARAIGKHRPGYGWERDDDTWRNYTQIVEWALAAVEPLIRAQIAADIARGDN